MDEEVREKNEYGDLFSLPADTSEKEQTPGNQSPTQRDPSVEPWEEPSNTQGFQHGTWDYEHGADRGEDQEATTDDQDR